MGYNLNPYGEKKWDHLIDIPTNQNEQENQ